MINFCFRFTVRSKQSTGVIDTRGKFATGFSDTGGDFDLRISPSFFEQIRNDPHVIFRGLGECMIHEKKPEANNLMSLSL